MGKSMSSDYIPAPTGSTESAASQVTTQTVEPTTPQADKPAGLPQADKPAGQEIAQQAASGEGQSQDGEQPKTWKEKRQERNRERWQEYKEAKSYVAQRLATLEQEVQRFKGNAPDFSQILDPNEEVAERAAWKVRQHQANDAEARLQSEREAAAAQQSVRLQNAWQEQVQEARKAIPDFDSVVTGETPIHERAAPYIVESDKGAEIAYWLGKPENREAAISLFNKFASGSPQALIELGRIEARLSAPASKTLSTTPKPAPTLNGGMNPIAFDARTAGVADMAAQLRKAGVIH